MDELLCVISRLLGTAGTLLVELQRASGLLFTKRVCVCVHILTCTVVVVIAIAVCEGKQST